MGDFFKGKSESKSSSSSSLTPWAPASAGVSNAASQATGFLGNPMEYYPGQTYLNNNAQQIGGLDAILAAANGMQENVVDPSLQAWQSLMGGPDQTMWDTALDSYADRGQRTLERTILSGINDAATMSGGRTSSRSGLAEGIARADTGANILDFNNQLAMDFERLKQNGQQFGLDFSGDLSNLLLQPGNAIFDAATARRGDEYSQLTEDVNRYNFNEQSKRTNVTDMGGFLGNLASQFGTQNQTSKTTTSQSASPFSQLAGAAMAAYGIGSGGGAGSLMDVFGAGNAAANAGGIGMNLAAPGYSLKNYDMNRLFGTPMNYG